MAESRKVLSTEFPLSSAGGIMESTRSPATLCDSIGGGWPNQGEMPEPWYPEFFDVLLLKHN